MQYRDILGVLAIAMVPVIGVLDTVRAGETDKGAILANKFDEKCFDTIRDSMPPERKGKGRGRGKKPGRWECKNKASLFPNLLFFFATSASLR